MAMTIKEIWQPIRGFPNYDVSNVGRIYNHRRDSMMSTSLNNHGYLKITLVDESGERHTRSVSLLVAEAFVEAPDLLCDQVVVLDGDLTNVIAENLVWRPRGFAWKYFRQLRTSPARHYQILPVLSTTDGMEYDSVVDAGMKEGLLFDDIWRSTYSGARIYPTNQVFEVIEG